MLSYDHSAALRLVLECTETLTQAARHLAEAPEPPHADTCGPSPIEQIDRMYAEAYRANASEPTLTEADHLRGEVARQSHYINELEHRLEQLRSNPTTEAALDTLIDILNRPIGGIGILGDHGSVRDFVRRALSEWRGALRS